MPTGGVGLEVRRVGQAGEVFMHLPMVCACGLEEVTRQCPKERTGLRWHDGEQRHLR